MMTPFLGSILLGSADPARLRAWYDTALAPEHGENGFLVFGGVGVLIDNRDDVNATNLEPGRVILNFHVDDARAVAAHLNALGTSWLVDLEQREDGLFGTLIDPDGNYIQIIEFSEAYQQRRNR